MKKAPLMILLSAAGISLSPFALADGSKPDAPLTVTANVKANKAGKAEKAIHAMLDQWHNDAARADRAYFDKMTENAVFIGTDPDERWTRAEFIKWSEPFFQRGKAWTFHVRQRHLKPDLSGKWAWFDEQLDTDLGLCQASGVVVLTAKGWKIDHYQLSISVKNELIEPLKKLTAELPAAKKMP